MDEIEGILNNPAIWQCHLIEYSVYCPFRENSEISCGHCIWGKGSLHIAKFKKLIPILLID
jgi:hypothetical protein